MVCEVMKNIFQYDYANTKQENKAAYFLTLGKLTQWFLNACNRFNLPKLQMMAKNFAFHILKTQNSGG